MTENNAAQPGLTDEEIEAVRRALEIYAECYDTMTRIAAREGREPVASPVSVAFDIRKNMVNAVVNALSKLRAEGVQAGEAVQWPIMPPSKGQSSVLFDDGYAEGWAKCLDECRRAALASAPVAGEAHTGNRHTLKTDPEVFQAVMIGVKTFEIRRNDRGFQVGDALRLRETRFTGAEMREGKPLEYTGRECHRVVSHVLTGYGLADGWCCLSFAAPQASEAVHLDDVKAIAREVAADGKVIRAEARNAALEEAASMCESWMMDRPRVSAEAVANQTMERMARYIRALKTQADKDGGDRAKGAGDE